jgi:hypothetical protein
MLNYKKIFATCSQRAWTFACEASYQNTEFQDGSVWQDEILSIVEYGALCVVTCGKEDGSIYQDSIDLDDWYGLENSQA